MGLPADDEGFTLVELLLAIAIMLVIIVPLSASFVLGIGTANGSLQDTTNSADAQLLAGFFDTDVTSAETVATSGSCAGAGTVLHLTWKDGGRNVEVGYRAVTDAAMQAELATTTPIDRLERVQCVDGAVQRTDVVARSVLRTGGLTVTCDGGPCSDPRPRRVEVQVVAFAPQFADKGSTTGRYTYGVTATRKVTP